MSVVKISHGCRHVNEKGDFRFHLPFPFQWLPIVEHFLYKAYIVLSTAFVRSGESFQNPIK